MNKEKAISNDRKKYLKRNKTEKLVIKIVQFSIVIGLIVLWEFLANKGIIDSFNIKTIGKTNRNISLSL